MAKWLYYEANNIDIKIVCQSVSERITLTGSIILKLQPSCDMYHDTIKLTPLTHGRSSHSHLTNASTSISLDINVAVNHSGVSWYLAMGLVIIVNIGSITFCFIRKPKPIIVTPPSLTRTLFPLNDFCTVEFGVQTESDYEVPKAHKANQYVIAIDDPTPVHTYYNDPNNTKLLIITERDEYEPIYDIPLSTEITDS